MRELSDIVGSGNRMALWDFVILTRLPVHGVHHHGEFSHVFLGLKENDVHFRCKQAYQRNTRT